MNPLPIPTNNATYVGNQTPVFQMNSPFTTTSKPSLYKSRETTLSKLDYAMQIPQSKVMRPFLAIHGEDNPFAKIGFTRQPPRIGPPALPEPQPRSKAKILVHQFE